MLRRSRTLNGTKTLSITSYFLMAINIFYNPSLKLITKKLDLMISSRAKDMVSLLTFLDRLVLVSDLHTKPRTQLKLSILLFRENLLGRSYKRTSLQAFVCYRWWGSWDTILDFRTQRWKGYLMLQQLGKLSY